jgi:hypothetical protein
LAPRAGSSNEPPLSRTSYDRFGIAAAITIDALVICKTASGDHSPAGGLITPAASSSSSLSLVLYKEPYWLILIIIFL